ncbi:MAG: tyrosine phosphatase family protein [Actinomycetota bacterium]
MPLVPYKITICGLAELCRHSAAGVTHVLTILDPGHPDPGDFAGYGAHRRTVWRYHDIIAARDGHVVPTERDVAAILDFGDRTTGIGHLLVHCHMGISRSTAAAAILLAQHNPGRERDAFAEVRAIRPSAWPNSLMIRMADAALGRGGALVEAMREHHLLVARAFPDLVAQLRGGEREPELPEDMR